MEAAIIEHNFQQHQQQKQPAKLVDIICKSTVGSAAAAKEKINESKKHAVALTGADFYSVNHFYPKTQRARIGRVGREFFTLSNDEAASIYCRRNPATSRAILAECLAYKPAYFKWAGCDLFNVVDGDDRRQMVIIETNSCPSGSSL